MAFFSSFLSNGEIKGTHENCGKNVHKQDILKKIYLKNKYSMPLLKLCIEFGIFNSHRVPYVMISTLKKLNIEKRGLKKKAILTVTGSLQHCPFFPLALEWRDAIVCLCIS